MTKTVKQYDCQAAIVAVALAMARKEEPSLRLALSETTDIPEDRLDFAAHEIGQMLPALKAMVGVLAFLEMDETKLEEIIRETIGTALWTDDDKRNLTVQAWLEEEGKGEPLVTVKTKLKEA